MAALANAATVCPSVGQPSQGYEFDCDLGACDYCTLAIALDYGETDIELTAGTHLSARTAMVWQEDTVITGVDAVLVALQHDEPLITVTQFATGSRLVDLEIVSGGNDDGPLTKVTADNVEIIRPSATGLESATSEGGGAIRVINAAGVWIEEPLLVGSDARGIGRGAALLIDRSTVEISGGEISGSTGFWGAVRVEASTGSRPGTRFVDNASDDFDGSQVSATGSELAFDGVTIDAPSADLWGTLIGATGSGTLSMVGGSVSGRGQGYGAGLVAVEDLDWLTIDGAVFDGHEQTAISAIDIGAVELTGAMFRGSPDTMSFGALVALHVPVVDVTGSWFCDELAETGAALNLADSCDVACSVRDTVFSGGYAFDTGGAIRVDAGTLDVVQSSLVGNGGFFDGGAIDARGATLNMSHSLVVDTSSNVAAIAGPLGVFEFNGFGRNAERDTHVAFPEETSNLQGADPVFGPGADPCGGDLALTDDPANSWLIDNRVGVYTGCWVDADGDGFGSAFLPDAERVCSGGLAAVAGDCDDAAAGVYPGADDAWYDGVDADCAGDDDQDQDGDGVGAAVDCDDEDPALGDCSVGVGGGCVTAPGPGPLGLLIVAVLGRRRRR